MMKVAWRLGRSCLEGHKRELCLLQVLLTPQSLGCSFVSLLPDSFFAMEFWSHWFKRVIRWRIRIDFIFRVHTISFWLAWPKGRLQEKQGGILMSILIYMTRKQLNIGSIISLRQRVTLIKQSNRTPLPINLKVLSPR